MTQVATHVATQVAQTFPDVIRLDVIRLNAARRRPAHPAANEVRPEQSRILARDLEAARRFYAAAAQPLGLAIVDAGADGFALESSGRRVINVEAEQVLAGDFDERPETRPTHVAIEAPDSLAVRAFFRAAMEAGGREVGYPAIQPAAGQGSYYAAKVIDPDGNCIECGWRH